MLSKKSHLMWFFALICLCNQPLLHAEVIFTDYSETPLVQPLGSLLFYLDDYQSELKPSTTESYPPDKEMTPLKFTDEEVANLWKKVSQLSQAKLDEKYGNLIQRAHENYQLAKTLQRQNQLEQAHDLTKEACEELFAVWIKAQDSEQEKASFAPEQLFKSRVGKGIIDVNFDNNSSIPKKAKKAMRPHILPSNHSLKGVLDQLFSTRPTLNPGTFSAAGFNIISFRPRSYVCVASHPLLPGHLVKAYMDTELREKHDKPSWQWLVLRCEGAAKIRYIIENRHFKYFTVPQKWIYPLPENPSPPNDHRHIRHLGVLLVQDMNLASNEKNIYAWWYAITKDHLIELYAILTGAKGASYRPDNICYTQNGTFAFIDTEYPDKGPDLKSIRPFLRPEMLHYWDKLVKTGGR